jgi:hypothetical protein
VYSDSELDALATRLTDTLDDEPLYPGYSGYCGWNYECAVFIQAINLDRQLNLEVFDAETAVENFLVAATQFPQPGSNIQQAAWLYSPGDRVGLFGGLYNGRNIHNADTIVQTVRNGLLEWKKLLGCFGRQVGWGFLYGFSFEKIWIWADDAFIGGFPLVYSDPALLGQMILDYNRVLRDPSDNLWWHGARVGSNGNIETNGVKWGRANAWMLLACATFLLETRDKDDLFAIRSEISDLLASQLTVLVNNQRDSGAFGNVLDHTLSPDETSLTSVFVFAVGAENLLGMDPPSPTVVDAAEKAWIWLTGRTVTGLTVSDTCGSQHLATDIEDYDKNVGVVAGPGLALLLWASLGARLLGFD